jgi:hypothetical protein
MENTLRKTQNYRKRISAPQKDVAELSKRVRRLTNELSENRILLLDTRKILEDQLLLGVPADSAGIMRMLEHRYPLCGSVKSDAWQSIVGAWARATPLRALVKEAPVGVRERFIALIRGVIRRDPIADILEHYPLTAKHEQVLRLLLEAWQRETGLRDLVRTSDADVVDRFVGFVRAEVLRARSLTDFGGNAGSSNI